MSRNLPGFLQESRGRAQLKQFDLLLARFFLSVKKANQSECEPDTIMGYQSALQRLLKAGYIRAQHDKG